MDLMQRAASNACGSPHNMCQHQRKALPEYQACQSGSISSMSKMLPDGLMGLLLPGQPHT